MTSFEESSLQPVHFGELVERVVGLYPEEARESLTRVVRLHVPTVESWRSVYELPAHIQLAITEDLLWQDFGIRQYVAHGTAV